jgi:predicted Zn-dependent protease
LLRTAGQGEEAITVIQSALALTPENIDLQLDLARLKIQRNARQEARAILMKLRDAAPGAPPSWWSSAASCS